MLTYYRSHERLLQTWLEVHKLGLISKRVVLLGSPWLVASPAQRIYDIMVRNQEGRVLHAWVRCGSMIRGANSQRVEVIWGNGNEDAVS